MAGEKPPSEAQLYEAALNHLARYAGTEQGLRQVLERRIDRWARRQGDEAEGVAAAARQARQAILAVIVRLREVGVLNDAAFASSRAKRLTNQGKSRRATLAHLAGKGVARGVAAEAIADDPDRELAAACAYLRRRRAGPFGDAALPKVLGAMARAGFSQATSRRAIALDREDAEARIRVLQDPIR